MKNRDLEKKIKNEAERLDVPEMLGRVKKAPLKKTKNEGGINRVFSKKFMVKLLVFTLLIFAVMAFTLFVFSYFKTDKTSNAGEYRFGSDTERITRINPSAFNERGDGLFKISHVNCQTENLT